MKNAPRRRRRRSSPPSITAHPAGTAAGLLAANIDALLRGHGRTKKNLADWCDHSQTWLGQFLKGRREMQLKDLDRVAEFFGLEVHQLFEPGIVTTVTRWLEPRAVDRGSSAH